MSRRIWGALCIVTVTVGVVALAVILCQTGPEDPTRPPLVAIPLEKFPPEEGLLDTLQLLYRTVEPIMVVDSTGYFRTGFIEHVDSTGILLRVTKEGFSTDGTTPTPEN